MTRQHSDVQPAHIGWDLWQATFAWKDRYVREMAARGYPWYGEARGNLMQHITADGIGQSDLVTRSGLTKQAVQQLLDELALDGVIDRVADPADSRRRMLILTESGLQALRTANVVKRAIEKDYRSLIGASNFVLLREALEAILRHERGRC